MESLQEIVESRKQKTSKQFNRKYDQIVKDALLPIKIEKSIPNDDNSQSSLIVSRGLSTEVKSGQSPKISKSESTVSLIDGARNGPGHNGTNQQLGKMS